MKNLRLVAAVSFGLIGVGGCEDAEPPATLYRDLGTEDQPLLPTSSAWHDPNITKGQSEWRPFREPEAPLADGDRKPPDGNRGGSPADSIDRKQIEADIRALIEEFNQKVAAGAPEEERLEFFVESQRPKLKEIAAAVQAFRGKMIELREVVKDRSAEAGAILDRAIEHMKPPGNELLNLQSIAVDGETSAHGRLSPPEGAPASADAMNEVRFVLAEEYWFIEFAALDQAAAMLPMLQAAMPQFDVLIQGVRSGKIPADAVTSPLAAMLPSPSAAAQTPTPGDAGKGTGTAKNNGG